MSFRRILPLLAVVTLASCFPIELDTSPDGKILITRQEGFFVVDPKTGETALVRKAEGGKPVFAKFSPDGKQVLSVIEAKDGFNEFDFHIGPTSGGETKKLHRVQNGTYTAFSPDGKTVAITHAAKEKKPPLEDAAPTLDLVTVAGGEVRAELVHNIAPRFAWFPDSKRILLFTIAKKVESDYAGQLSIFDPETGRLEKLVALAPPSDFYFDLSPDGSSVLFVADAIGKPDEDIEIPDFADAHLYLLDVKTKAVRKVHDDVKYAMYSPSGKQVLIGAEDPETFSLDTLDLKVADPAFEKVRVVAKGVHTPAMSLGGEGIVYPGWIDEENVFYFLEHIVYGSSAKSLHLVTSKLDGTGRAFVQPKIDAKVFEIAE